MITVNIKYVNGDVWTCHFDDTVSAQSWINVEKTRFYWNDSNKIEIVDNTPKAPSKKDVDNAKWCTIRLKRDNALTSCDWTMLGDAPLNNEQKAIMANYRTKLRDLPESFATPDDVIFPEEPKIK